MDIDYMLVNQYDEFEIHRDGQVVLKIDGYWNTEQNFIGFAGSRLDVRVEDQIVGTLKNNHFRVFNVQQLSMQTRALVETETDYQRRMTAAQPGIHINMTNSAFQHNSPNATQRVTIGKQESGFLTWVGSAFGFIKRAVMFFKTGKAE